MKYIPLAYCVFLGGTLMAQQKKFNTNIDTAIRVTINGGTTTIAKADTVFIGQVVINQKTNDSIYFVGSVTVYDSSSKYYTTQYTFVPQNHTISFDVDVAIRFDKPFSPWYTTSPPPRNTIILGRDRDIYRVNALNGEAHTVNLQSSDFESIRVRGSVVGDALFIVLKSREKLYAKIESIYGAIGRKDVTSQ